MPIPIRQAASRRLLDERTTSPKMRREGPEGRRRRARDRCNLVERRGMTKARVMGHRIEGKGVRKLAAALVA